MYSIDRDTIAGTIIIGNTFSLTDQPKFGGLGSVPYIISIIDIEDVQKFTTFGYNASGSSNSRYLSTFYRISRDNVSWTNWLELLPDIDNFPPFDSKDKMSIDIKWERNGSTTGTMSLTDYTLVGKINRNLSDGESTIVLNQAQNSIIIKPPHIFKVFKITDIEVLSKGDIDNTNIRYRFSQDYGRSVSQWEPFTKENMTTLKVNPVRFFQIEYLIEYSGSSTIKIFDINIIGDFQNVTMDSQKTNVYGVRENCSCLMLNMIDGKSNNPLVQTETPNGSFGEVSCVGPLSPMTADEAAKLFKPYQQNQAVNLLNQLSNDSNQLFGHEVVYFITDPDKKGIDFTFHEYQLYNYVCSDLINVSVENNSFPDNQIAMNQFDLSLFESFEIHIPKQTFKQIFGVEKRPSKEDFLWFCSINRMFVIEHAQQFRGFNNQALYYKVILKKFSQKSNVIGANKSITDRVNELTKNSTIDELFGAENSLDKKDVSNKEQFRPLTKDVLRAEIKVDIDKELIENSTNIISKSNYDLSSVDINKTAILYRNIRNYFKVSDNFSFYMWFNIHNYTVNDEYHFMKYYDDVNNLGFKSSLESDSIKFTLNSDEYRFNIGTVGNADALVEGTWYCYVANIDQRQRKLNQWIYKRNVDDESEAHMLGSTILKKVFSDEQDISIVEFEILNSNVEILGSDMKMTNIRLFNDVIPQSEHNRILNQAIIGDDYRYLIFADNANTRLVLPSLMLNQTNPNIIRGEINKEKL